MGQISSDRRLDFRSPRAYDWVVRIECPICRRVIEDAADDFAPRPFCSLRCKRIDLMNWLEERYKISRPLLPEDLEDDELILR